MSSEDYYSIRALRIHRSYPIYHPDREPPGYWEWLEQQEPEVVFDATTLKTKEDWIRAGELVFNAGHEYSTGIELDFIRDPAAFEATRIPLAADGSVAFARYFIREKGKVEVGTNARAACHTCASPSGSRT